jgi:hypothetical protein
MRVRNLIRIPIVEKHLIDRTPVELSQTLHQIKRNQEALEILEASDDEGKLDDDLTKEVKKPCL